MTTKHTKADLPPRKKLIEVALPLEAINRESAREKSIRHGHPSTLHLWWARRPLAACRAVLFASLVDDPSSDPAYRNADGSVDEERAGEKRAELFNLIEELVKWENSNNPKVINAARAEIARCVASRKIETGELVKDTPIALRLPEPEWTGKPPRELTAKPWDFVIRRAKPEQVDAFLLEHAPPVLDPFCGGGSIPLEAERLGLDAVATDLNPVPVLITRTLIESPHKFAGMTPVSGAADAAVGSETTMMFGSTDGGPDTAFRTWPSTDSLAIDVEHYGKWVRSEAESRLGHLYPTVPVTQALVAKRPDLEPYLGQELTILAWIWARTVPSPNPAFSKHHTPLPATFNLCTKSGKEAWLHAARVDNRIEFSVRMGKPPANRASEIKSGAKISRGKFKCLLSDSPIPPQYLKDCGHNKLIGSQLMAVVAEGQRERLYLSPADVPGVQCERATLFDDVPTPPISGYFNPWVYGYDSVGSLFNDRQTQSLQVFSDLVSEVFEKVQRDGGTREYAATIATFLTLTLGRLANRNNSFCTWDAGWQKVTHTFAEQGVGMSWDFAEVNPLSNSTGSWDSTIKYTLSSARATPHGRGRAMIHDATRPFPQLKSPPLISTDPPYFSSLTYADFADFFYCIHRRCLRPVYPELYATVATPKDNEIVAAWHRFEGSKTEASKYFTARLSVAFANVRVAAGADYPITIYYAFKQQESRDVDDELITAWESILEVVVSSGLRVEATWPVRTEYTTTRKAHKNALASSIVISCRPLPKDAPLASRGEFVASLRRELPKAMRELQSANIAPVDLAQAAVGPGMSVFTRYARVIESNGERMTVRSALSLINHALDEVLTEQEGDFDSDSRWALTWFDQQGFEEGEFGEADVLARAKNTSVQGLVDAGIVVAGRGRVRLLPPVELPSEWDPLADLRLTSWEMVHHLIRALETGGETAAADLVAKLGGNAETARELCYRLYTICERKKRANEAMSYNALVQSWPEIVRLAREGKKARPSDSGLFNETEG